MSLSIVEMILRSVILWYFVILFDIEIETVSGSVGKDRVFVVFLLLEKQIVH